MSKRNERAHASSGRALTISKARAACAATDVVGSGALRVVVEARVKRFARTSNKVQFDAIKTGKG